MQIADNAGPIVVVGGSGRNAGKTALICGLIRALPEFAWTAVKISGHDHGMPQSIWEDTAPGMATDTGRYLAAGASRAIFVTATADELGTIIQPLLDAHRQQGFSAALVFESNRILEHVRPAVCLAVEDSANPDPKPSFQLVTHQKDATVVLGAMDGSLPGDIPLFRLAALDRIAPEMLAWLRARLQGG